MIRSLNKQVKKLQPTLTITSKRNLSFTAMSRKYRVEVGVQALDCMIEILKGEDRNDEEIVGYALDTLANICCPDEFDEEIPVSQNQFNV